MIASAHFAVLFAVIFAISIAPQPSSCILLGKRAAIEDFPYAASIFVVDVFRCGGSIIGNRFILTAADCFLIADDIFTDPSNVYVGVGSNNLAGEQMNPVRNFQSHPEFNRTTFKNDIAVVVLLNPLQWTDRIQMINIATSSADLPSIGSAVATAGYGQYLYTSIPYYLHSTSLRVGTDEVCSPYSAYNNSTVCLTHRLLQGSCLGDAGNGVIYNNKLVGVCNYIGFVCGNFVPEFFANVAYHASWIQSVINSN